MKHFKAMMLFSLCLSAAAWAQAQPSTGTAPSPDVSVPRKQQNTVYDFSDVDILGKLKTPEGKGIVDKPDFGFKRLLDLDESFIPNITRSVDDY